MSFDLEGGIDAIAVPHLIYSACSTRETGVLRLRRGEREKTVYIKEGRLVFATSNDRDDRLGQVLLRAGKIGVEQLAEATEKSLQQGIRLGKALVDAGWLRPEELVQGVIDQVQEILYGIFEWTEGEYQLRLGDLPTSEVITLNVHTEHVLMEGIRRVRSWYRIQEALGGIDVPYRHPPDVDRRAARMKLKEDELSLLISLEQPTTIRELCRWSPLNDFEIGRILWAFLVAGLVVRAGAGAQQIG